MATELAKAYVQIIPSARGMSSNLASALGPEADKAGSAAGAGIGRNIASTIGGVMVAAGVGKIITDAVMAGGALEQNIGGTEAVFGSFAKNIQASATDAYKNMGMSASDYMGTANKMGSLFQGSGMTQAQALEMTSSAMQRAADVASVMGVDTSMAMESIAGAAKGNFTMMDNLGVSMNATSLAAYAMEKGINFDWNTADQAQKSELAMAMFMDRTSQYAGNFAKESTETFSGSLGAMQSSWTNVMGAISTGQGVGEALATLGGSVATFAKNLLPMVGGIIKELPNLLVTLLEDAGPSLITGGIQMIADLAKGLGDSLPTLIPRAVEAILTIVDGLIDNIPMLIDGALALILGLAKGLILAIPALVKKLPKIIDGIIKGLQKSLPLIIQAGVELLTALAENAPAIIEGIVEVLPQIITALIDAVITNIPLIVNAGVQLFTALITNLPLIIGTIVKAMPGLIRSILDALGEGVQQFMDMGVQFMEGLAQGIGDSVENVITKAKEAASGIVSAVREFFGAETAAPAAAAKVGASVGKSVSGSAGTIKKALTDMADLTTGTLQSNLAVGLKKSSALAYSSAGGGSVGRTVNNYSMTVNTHDSLSPAELTREQEDMAAKMNARWRIK